MIAPDSSVLIAGFTSTHRFHETVLAPLAEVMARGSLIAHTIAETYSVLSAPGGIYRAEPESVVSYLDQFLGEDPPIPVRPVAYREALALLAGSGRPGGAVFDALIALAARDAGAELISLDRRAAPTYDLCGAAARQLAEA